LNNRFPVFCDHHGPAALGDLVHHGEALRFELGSVEQSPKRGMDAA
jgi:hypothetical protein